MGDIQSFQWGLGISHQVQVFPTFEMTLCFVHQWTMYLFCLFQKVNNAEK